MRCLPTCSWLIVSVWDVDPNTLVHMDISEHPSCGVPLQMCSSCTVPYALKPLSELQRLW